MNFTKEKSKEKSITTCRHTKHKIAEREFHVNQKNQISGTRIICKKCGSHEFIKDAEYGVYQIDKSKVDKSQIDKSKIDKSHL